MSTLIKSVVLTQFTIHKLISESHCLVCVIVIGITTNFVEQSKFFIVLPWLMDKL